MGTILTIITGALSVFNYYYQPHLTLPLHQTISLVAQGLMTFITIIALCAYTGKKVVVDYKVEKPKILTLGFFVALLSTLINLGVVVLLGIKWFGMMKGMYHG
ncbi:hypothetical protein FACS1894111_02080 [Clostridia bacterium]|nr:hypothetical protein FACS1894111_02080 [Clostridia bacterium]